MTTTDYTPATMFTAEGARCGIVTCLECGAAILIDPRDIDATHLHTEWHQAQT